MPAPLQTCAHPRSETAAAPAVHLPLEELVVGRIGARPHWRMDAVQLAAAAGHAKGAQPWSRHQLGPQGLHRLLAELKRNTVRCEGSAKRRSPHRLPLRGHAAPGGDILVICHPLRRRRLGGRGTRGRYD